MSSTEPSGLLSEMCRLTPTWWSLCLKQTYVYSGESQVAAPLIYHTD